MSTLLVFVAALALAAIPLTIGWRRGAGEAGMARALGLTPGRHSFDSQRFARQTGTGLTFNQLLLGCLAWIAGGFLAGLFLGPIAASLFASAGGLFYAGGLYGRRQEFRLRQAGSSPNLAVAARRMNFCQRAPARAAVGLVCSWNGAWNPTA